MSVKLSKLKKFKDRITEIENEILNIGVINSNTFARINEKRTNLIDEHCKLSCKLAKGWCELPHPAIPEKNRESFLEIINDQIKLNQSMAIMETLSDISKTMLEMSSD